MTEVQILRNVSGVLFGETVQGQTSCGLATVCGLNELKAEEIQEETARRLLRELIKLYPLDALASID